MNSPSQQALRHLGGLSAEEFIEQYWQKKPLLVRSAFSDTEAWVDADTLAGLALEEAVESRIVSGHQDLGPQSWQLKHGPFDETLFAELGEENWALLIQAVDHYLPSVAQLMPQFNFIPAWRQDDIMVSYSVPGGSVGPHFDQYDVFLLQGSGEKTWHVGHPCDEHAPLLEQSPLRILSEFETRQSWLLKPGDMLYLPTNVAHYGLANTEGITLSVGFRAPTTEEFLHQFADVCANHFENKIHYRDADLTPQKNNGWISPTSVQKFQTVMQELINDEQYLAQTVAQLASQPKYPNQQCPNQGQELHDSQPSLAQLLQQAPTHCLIRDENTRINYLGNEDQPQQLFINGEARQFPPAAATTELLLLIAGQRIIQLSQLKPLLTDLSLFHWFETLYQAGYFYYDAPN